MVYPLCFKSVKPNAAVLKNALRKPGSPFYQHQSCCTDCHIHENRNRPEADRSQMYHSDDFRVKETFEKKMASIWVFPKFWGTPQWMGFFFEMPSKMDDLGIHPFSETSICQWSFFFATQFFESYCIHDFLIPLACTCVQRLSGYVV